MAKGKNGSGRGSRKRRGRAEAVTGAQEGAVEHRVASASAELPLPEKDRQVFYFDELKKLEEQKTTIGSKIRLLHKSAKAEGVNMDSVKDVTKMVRGDQAEWRTRMEQTAQLMREKGMAFQLNVFDTAFGSDIEQAKFEARTAAKAGKDAENRYAPGSDAHKAYADEYAKIQAAMVPGAGDLSEEERETAIQSGREAPQLEMHH